MSGMIAGRQLNSTRDRYDFYPTDPAWAEALLRRVEFVGDVTEPCAGDGAIVRVLRAHNFKVKAVDIEPRAPGIRKGDALKIRSANNIVTNAPFRGASEMVQHWLRITARKVAVLAQASFLESKVRGQLYTMRPPVKVIMVCKRMTVLGKVSQFPHAWIVWDNECAPGHTIIEWETDL